MEYDFHIFSKYLSILGISNEKPSILMEIPSISIEILAISNQKI